MKNTIKDHITEYTHTKYEVNFGQKDIREQKTFFDENQAMDFFAKKDKEGFHVDAYEVEVKTTRKKLSK